MKVHAGVAIVALLIGLVAGASLTALVDIGGDDPVVIAAETEANDDETGDEDRRGWEGHHCAFVERWTEHRDDLLEDFAAELGVTPDEVMEAARNVAASRLSTAVEEGRISEEKADRLLGMIEDPGALCDD